MEEDATTCSICLEALGSRPVTTLSGCGHAFHADCVCHALQHTRGTCPLCRYQPEAPTPDFDLSPPVSPQRFAERSEWHAQRGRAIRSCLLRVRHATASDVARRAAGNYRTLRDAISSEKKRLRDLRKRSDAQHRAHREEYVKLMRRVRQATTPLRRQWMACESKIEGLEARHRSLGDLLAKENGFTDPCP